MAAGCEKEEKNQTAPNSPRVTGIQLPSDFFGLELPPKGGNIGFEKPKSEGPSFLTLSHRLRRRSDAVPDGVVSEFESQVVGLPRVSEIIYELDAINGMRDKTTICTFGVRDNAREGTRTERSTGTEGPVPDIRH